MKFIKKNKVVILFYLELAIVTLIIVKFAF